MRRFPFFGTAFTCMCLACFTGCTPEAGKPLPAPAVTHTVAVPVTVTAQALAGNTYPLGDIDGDGRTDRAHLRYHEDTLSYTEITFTGKLPKLRIEGYPGHIATVGDLDGNGTDEFIYNQVWQQGNNSPTYVYGNRRGQWVLFAEGSVWLDRMWNAPEDPERYLQNGVKKMDNRRFYLNDLRFDAADGYLDTMPVKHIPH